jgi:hypothetical protein
VRGLRKTQNKKLPWRNKVKKVGKVETADTKPLATVARFAPLNESFRGTEQDVYPR